MTTDPMTPSKASVLTEQVARIFDEPVSDRAAARKAVVMVARAVESRN